MKKLQGFMNLFFVCGIIFNILILIIGEADKVTYFSLTCFSLCLLLGMLRKK